MKRSPLAAIGLMVLLAICLVTRALLFLHPSPGDGGLVLHVRFQNVDKISRGSRVTFAGKPVGEVISVAPIPETTLGRKDHGQPIYSYEVTLALDSSIKVYKTDSIAIKSAGLMGERFIEITPTPFADGSPPVPLGPTDIVDAARTGSPEEMIQDLSSLAKKADATMEACISLINRNQEGIAQATEAVSKASEQISAFFTSLNDRGVAEKISSVSYQTDQLMRDIHEYGFFFHLNRDWQRGRYQKLKDPSEDDLQERFAKINKAMSELRVAAEKRFFSKNQPLTDRCRKELAELQVTAEALQQGGPAQ